ncbi:hypothetical protein BDF14DRAFT_1861379 [Spinellus fusiger]|nr:hypothetical protein BDF14DRAFT_1861379 [Spinellus fusiger]
MPTQQLRRRYLGGVLALLGVVFIWVSSSFVMNSIFGEQKYNKPFLITYLNTATFSFYLVPLLFRKRTDYTTEETAKLLTPHVEAIEARSLVGSASLLEQTQPALTVSKLSTKQTIKLSLAFCILWFFANYTTNASLAYTSVGSSTILASMSGLFTLGIGAAFGVEKLNLIKIVAVGVSLTGVILVSYSDQTSVPTVSEEYRAPSPLVGDLLALFGAVFYGGYTTMLKLRIGDESRINMPLFFGFVGTFNVVLLWPAFPILHYLGLETFELPPSPIVWLMILLNAFVGTFLSDYLWLLSMLMTSPLVVTLGISLTIPLALIGDILLKQIIPGMVYAAGALLVGIGFFMVNMDALREVEDTPYVAEQEDFNAYS